MKNRIKRIKSELAMNLINIHGWTTNRKIVVFESDDWGSIRMPSRIVYEQAIANGYKVSQNIMEKYDSLESEDDLSLLFDLLLSFKDSNGKPPIFTANCLVANPDFAKIKQFNFNNYFFELVTETFKKYPNHAGSFQLWIKGFEEEVFFPQSHGREHLNVNLFMNNLRAGNPDTLFGFKNGMPGSLSLKEYEAGNIYVETLNYKSKKDKEEMLKIILDGLDIFKKLLGYRSESFIPPNYIWSHDFDEALFQSGVKFFQGISKMREPNLSNGFNFEKIQLGEKNKFGQYYLVRNCGFEPAHFSNTDPVGYCLKGIETAFRWKKPAIISTHRVNYIGSIFPENRNRNLGLLKELLIKIIKRWPDVEFFNSVELGKELAD